jgi:hypothetical protein
MSKPGKEKIERRFDVVLDLSSGPVSRRQASAPHGSKPVDRDHVILAGMDE